MEQEAGVDQGATEVQDQNESIGAEKRLAAGSSQDSAMGEEWVSAKEAKQASDKQPDKDTGKGAEKSKFKKIALWALLVFLLFSLSLSFNDTDLYYLIASGRQIISAGAVPTINPMIAEPDCGIVVQNWLYCVLVAAVNDSLHTGGLWLLQSLFLLGMVACIFRFFGFRKAERKGDVGIFTMLVLLIFGYWNLRPEMLTFILIMVEILCLERYRDKGQWACLFLLPLTTLLEINCHASYWIMHYIVLLPYLVPMPKFTGVGYHTSFSKEQLKKLILPVVLMTAALLVNPYGFDAISYVFVSLSSNVVTGIGIGEQNSPSLASSVGLLVLVLLLIFIYLWAKKQIDSVSAFMFLGFWVLIFTAMKWISFLAIGVMFLLRAASRYAGNALSFENALFKVKTALFVVFIAALALVGGVLISRGCLEFYDFKTDDYLTNHPSAETGYQGLVEFCDYLDENDADAVVYSRFSLNNYFEFRGYTVLYDARPEVYTEDATGKKDIIGDMMNLCYGYDFFGYLDAQKNDMLEDETFFLGYEAYGQLIEECGAEYFVVSLNDVPMSVYFESQPDDYELLMENSSGQFWHKV